MKRRWVLRNATGETFLEHGLRHHLQLLLVVAICNLVASGPGWGPQFRVSMERVR